MPMKEVQAQDFMTFSRETPAHVLIEQQLIDMGGGGNKGVEFKKEVMTAAGWKYGKLVSYGAHPEVAADAFNRIRGLLEKARSADELLAQLKH